MVRKILLIVIILCSLEFYQFSFIPAGFVRASTLIGLGIIAALIVMYLVYGTKEYTRKRFVLPIILIFISVLISMMGSYAFQGQSFTLTLYGQRAIYYYLIYFLLHLMKIDDDFIIKTLLAFGVTFISLYLLQFFVYPFKIISSQMFVDRGTLRIGLNGSGYLVIAYFIWLYLTVKEYKLKYIVFLLLSMTIFVLLGTRQLLASIFLLTLLYLLQSRLIKSKFLISLMFGLALIPIYFLFQEIFQAMFMATLEQSQDVEGNRRIEAIKFFLTQFFPNDLSYLTGNGAPYSSMYRLRLFRYSEEYGYYLSDIGLIGEYIQFGVLFVISVFIIFFKVFRYKLSEKFMFIKYNYLGLVLTLIMAGGAFGSSGENILVNCMLLYLVDLHLSEEHTSEHSTVK